MNVTYETERLLLQLASPAYLREVLAFQCRNREIFEQYEPVRPENFYTLGYQQNVLKAEQQLALKLSTIRFYVFRKGNPQLVIGTVCLHDVARIAYSCCEIGYKFDHDFWNRGYAREAVAEAVRIAFDELGLHRVFARVQPENLRSRRLLEALSFFPEGIERECICINGKWTDHLRYALIRPHD
ncbi:MAG: GNAT family N-acetyltransferase [Roseburia sp.]